MRVKNILNEFLTPAKRSNLVFGKIITEPHIHENYEDSTNKILPVSTLGLKGAPPSGGIDLII